MMLSFFFFKEQARAFTLFNEIKNNEAIKEHLGNSEYTKLKQLQSSILEIEYKMKNNQAVSNSEKANLSLQRNKLNEQVLAMTEGFQKYKFSENLDFRKLVNNSQTILSYYWMETSLMVSLINSTNINSYKIPFIKDKICLIEEYEECLTSDSSCSLDSIKSKSRQLYQLLIGPFENELSKDLVIIPHGKISAIPFESLIDINDEYLITQKNISYNYSLHLMDELNEKYSAKKRMKMLAVAPEYYSNLEEHKFKPLTENVNEIEVLSKNFKTPTLLKNNASSKKEFLSSLSKANIVHIAGHADIDPIDSDYSFIAFNDNSGIVDSTLLFLSSLYTKALDLKMIVLSACNTGIGFYQEGEGILSLARGFIYAGTKSVVSSLWKADDRATKEIMINFYDYLSQGQSKDLALANAKRKYLDDNGGKRVHPYYWAGFIVLGDTSPIFNATLSFLSIALLIIVIIGIGFLLFKRMRSSASSY